MNKFKLYISFSFFGWGEGRHRSDAVIFSFHPSKWLCYINLIICVSWVSLIPSLLYLKTILWRDTLRLCKYLVPYQTIWPTNFSMLGNLLSELIIT